MHEVFNFNPEDNVNYKDQFKWFSKHHQIGLIAPESTERNQVNFNRTVFDVRPRCHFTLAFGIQKTRMFLE